MVQTASFTGFIRTLLIILLLYYVFKIALRFMAPYILQYMSKKMQDRFSNQHQQNPYTQQKTSKNGEVIIDKMPKKSSSSKSKVGEYIDYEELE